MSSYTKPALSGVMNDNGDYIGHNDHNVDGGDAEAHDDKDVNHEHQGY